MSYCTVDDIEANIPSVTLAQITSDTGSSVDETVIETAIDYVDNIIDGYLRGRYTLPLNSTPDELKYIAVDYVTYRLYSRRLMTEIPESISNRFKEVTSLLKSIQKGTFSLGIEDTNAVANPKLKTNKSLNTSSVNKYYNEDKWDEYDTWL